jgi:hypothetical protein
MPSQPWARIDLDASRIPVRHSAKKAIQLAPDFPMQWNKTKGGEMTIARAKTGRLHTTSILHVLKTPHCRRLTAAVHHSSLQTLPATCGVQIVAMGEFQ